jgi:hypothetical protein
VCKSTRPPKLIPSFEPSKDSSTPALCRVFTCAQMVLSVLSFPVASTSQETQFFVLPPSDGELRYPPGYPSLKQPLAESIRVFNNPVKILQWILPLNSRTQRVLFSCACLHTDSNAHLAKYLLTEHSTVLSSVHSLHLLNAHLAELHRMLSDSDSSS